MRCQEGKHYLGQRDAGDDKRRRPRFLAGIEHTQVQQHEGIRDEGKGREAQREAQYLGRLGVEGTVLEEAAGDRDTEARHEDDDGNQSDERQLRAQREVTDHGFDVAVGSVAGEPRHDRGEQGNADDAIGHLQEKPCLLVDKRRVFVRMGRHAGRNHITKLGNGHVGHNG